MSIPQRHSFSREGCGTLELELGEPQKTVFRGTVPESTWATTGLDEEDPGAELQRYLFEYQTVDYSFTARMTDGWKAPFQLRINDRVEKTSTAREAHGIHLLSGRFTIADAVGRTKVQVFDAANDLVFGLETEVFPQKMDYRSDYEAMMTDVASIVHNLVFEALKDTYRHTRAKKSGSTTENEWWSILEGLFEQLEQALAVIERQPKHEIRTTERVLPVDRIKQASKRNLDWLRKNGQYSNPDQGLRIQEDRCSTHALSTRKHVTYDTYENRFVAWAIRHLLQRLRRYGKDLEGTARTGDHSPVLARLGHYQRRLQAVLHRSPFSEVGQFEERSQFSLALTRGAGYRDFMVVHLLLSRGLELWENDLFRIDQKNISTLYEYWCFLKLVQLLKEQCGGTVDLKDLIKVKAGRIQVELRKGKSSGVHFKDTFTGAEATLFYNRSFPKDQQKVFTFDQKPDYSLRFKRPGMDQDFWYLFDAKYRFDERPSSSTTSYEAPKDAIGQLHRYRDAILHSRPVNTSYRTALKNLGGVILYPYPLSEHEFTSTNFYQSINSFNIGALPFLPSKTGLASTFLQDLLAKQPEQHFEDFVEMDRSAYEAERAKWKEWVTIGVIPHQHQKERLRFFEEKKVYHVPFVKDEHSRLFLSKELLVCQARSRKAVRCIVLHWEVLSAPELRSLGATWPLSHERYIVFTTTEHTQIETPAPLAPMRFRYASREGLERYLQSAGKDTGYFYLTNPDAARLYQSLRTSGVEFSVGWGSETSDPSLVEFNVGEEKIRSSDRFGFLEYKNDQGAISLKQIGAKLATSRNEENNSHSRTWPNS